MPPADVPVNLDAEFASFDELWAPRVVGEINDYELKIAKAEGRFVWHTHDGTDEFFLVHKGRLTIEMRGRGHVALGPGDFFVVPRGVEHCPVADAGCELVLLEPKGVVNTGDAPSVESTADEEKS
ncbi:MAG: cupin domain-containing protein [Acidimicrobiia bacterium]